jgi:ABC-type tungstate transport system permease subunit
MIVSRGGQVKNREEKRWKIMRGEVEMAGRWREAGGGMRGAVAVWGVEIVDLGRFQ